MCEVLGVSTSGYYGWRKRPPSQRQRANDQLLEAIREEHEASRRTYGSPRIQAALGRRGIKAGKNRIARLMHDNGIVSQARKRKRPVTTQRAPGKLAAPNILAQDFTTNRPNEVWLADITYVDTWEGWLYLALIMDLYARPIVGWSMADHLEATLVEQALLMALGRRLPEAGLVHHSDRGVQYTSHLIQSLLEKHHIQISMSGVGNCYDNAPMESLIGTLKTECITYRFASHTEARQVIFEYIEVWYNRQRLHSSLGYLSPVEFERQYFYPLQPVR
jgi:putative transposase